jgi:hypothetical protein
MSCFRFISCIFDFSFLTFSLRAYLKKIIKTKTTNMNDLAKRIQNIVGIISL